MFQTHQPVYVRFLEMMESDGDSSSAISILMRIGGEKNVTVMVIFGEFDLL